MPINILIIDNDTEQRTILCNAIKDKLGYEVTGVATQYEAANCFTSGAVKKPDLILFDISKIDKPSQAIANFRMINITVPIIVLARYGDYENSMAAISAGANDFLNKPVALERMSLTFRNTLLLHNVTIEDKNFTKSNVTNIITFSLFGDDGNILRMQDLEKEAIKCAMRHYDGRMTEVARRLGIGRSTLYRKISDFSIQYPERSNREEYLSAAAG